MKISKRGLEIFLKIREIYETFKSENLITHLYLYVKFHCVKACMPELVLCVLWYTSLVAVFTIVIKNGISYYYHYYYYYY